MAANLTLPLNSLGLYIRLPSMRTVFLMRLAKSSGLSSLNSSHSVTTMEQSEPLMHSVADGAYLILCLKIFLALFVAAGS